MKDLYVPKFNFAFSFPASVPTYGYGAVPRVPSTLSVTAVDIMVQAPCCPPSPAISNLTLTPGRTRDIDQDMEALRLSRQDNPFLQVHMRSDGY